MVVDHSDPKVTDESTDAYDTVAWLIKNIPGTMGASGSSAPAMTGP